MPGDPLCPKALGLCSPLKAKVHFLFVEKDQARADHLRRFEQTSPKPPSDATEAIYHSEVGSVLACMPAAERSKTIRQAIDTSDDRFVAGAVTGSPILTGLAAAEQQMFLETWRSRRHPEKTAQLARWKAGLAELDRLGPMFLKWSGQLFDEPDAAAVTAAEKSAEIARAATSA